MVAYEGVALLFSDADNAAYLTLLSSLRRSEEAFIPNVGTVPQLTLSISLILIKLCV